MKKPWHVPCLRGVIGEWVYYSALLKAEDISARVMTSKQIREAKALEDFLQRALKPRVKKIASYLRKRDTRFFNSIILGVFDTLPDWIELNLSSVGDKLDIPNVREIEKSLGLLVFFGTEKMFAIDGQHRVEGIKEAYKADRERIAADQYSVIFVAHRDDAPGKVRTRRLFCDINKNAVAVSEGDKVVIDEDDLCAVVARRIYAEYAPFKGGEEIAVSERKEVLVQKDQKGVERERFTSLLAVYTVAKKLKPLLKKATGSRPTASENVKQLQGIVGRFFDYIFSHESSLKSYRGRKTTLQKERKNNGNLFFRPIGLEILARLYAYFRKAQRLDRLTAGLARLDFGNPGGVFDHILWSAGRIKAGGKERTAAVELCLYLLGEVSTNRAKDLRNRLRDITQDADYSLPRKIIMSSGEKKRVGSLLT